MMSQHSNSIGLAPHHGEVQVLMTSSPGLGQCFLENGTYDSGVQHVFIHERNTTVVIHAAELVYADIFDVLLSTVDAVLFVFEFPKKYSLKALRAAVRDHPKLQTTPAVLVGLSPSLVNQAQARRASSKARRFTSEFNVFTYHELDPEDDFGIVFEDIVKATLGHVRERPSTPVLSRESFSSPSIVMGRASPSGGRGRGSISRDAQDPHTSSLAVEQKRGSSLPAIDKSGRLSKKEMRKMKKAEKKQKKMDRKLAMPLEDTPPPADRAYHGSPDASPDPAAQSKEEIELRAWLSEISSSLEHIAPALAAKNLTKGLIMEQFVNDRNLLQSILLDADLTEGQVLILLGKLSAGEKLREQTGRKRMLESREKKATMMFEELDVRSTLGHGAFGEVFKGRWREANVAIKQLRSELSTKEQKGHFLNEAELMMNLERHPNVVTCYGHCKDPLDNLYIVMEYASDGSLSDRLMNLSAEMLDSMSLLSIASGVAAGISHLARNNIVHRDIAARNILLQVGGISNQRLVYIPKISDFGLARVLSSASDHVKTEPGEKMAVRWMPPEFFTSRCFSLKGDVWSFGVCLWEIFSGGASLPFVEYASLSRAKQAILEGKMLARPTKCREDVYDLMRSCWNRDAVKRPNMNEVLKTIQALIGELSEEVSSTEDDSTSTALDDENYAVGTSYISNSG